MNESLREATSHGTREFPFAYYYMQNIRPGFTVSLHWHEEIEVLYMESGTLYLTINDTAYTGKAGDIFLVNPREIHGMTAHDPDTLYHAFVFPLRFVSFQSRNTGSNSFLLPLSEGKLLLHNRLSDAGHKKEAAEIIRQLLTLETQKPTGYQLGIQIFCARLLYSLYTWENYSLQKLSPFHEEMAVKREILTFLQNNYAEKISLHELADTFHMSEKYFSRYFKKNFQMTLTDYVNNLRLENAAKLLADTTLSVTEVALQSGFNNVSYFIRSFKTAYGCPPLQYRKG